LLAVVVTIINFNIGVNFKNAFIVQEKHLSEAVIEKIENEGKKEKEISRQRIKEITEEEYQRVIKEKQESREKIEKLKTEIDQDQELTGTGLIAKKKAKKLIEKRGTEQRKV